MLEQYASLGLPGGGLRVVAPLELRPVIAIAEPIGNAAVASKRMSQMVAALSDNGVPLPNLEIWVLGTDDNITVHDVGELSGTN